MVAEPLSVVHGPAMHGIGYFSTTRAGGVSPAPWASMNLGLHTTDLPARVHENRQRLQTMLPSSPVWLDQVHGTTVFDADLACDYANKAPVADAAITTRLGLPLLIMTADCLPVVIANSEGSAVGVAHAGWRGLAAGVLENTLAALVAKKPEGGAWHAWIGPAISQPNFEVGDDVFRAFVEPEPATVRYFKQAGPEGKWLADLPGLARHRLQQAGVAMVHCSGLCTYANSERFFSFRRKAVTGRIVTAAWLMAPVSGMG